MGEGGANIAKQLQHPQNACSANPGRVCCQKKHPLRDEPRPWVGGLVGWQDPYICFSCDPLRSQLTLNLNAPLRPVRKSFSDAKFPNKDIGKSHCFDYHIRKIRRGSRYRDQIVEIISESMIGFEQHATQNKIMAIWIWETEPLHWPAGEPMSR